MRTPRFIGEITPEWISAVLSRHHGPAAVTAVRFERIGVGYGLASELYRAHLEGKGCPTSVVIKLWATGQAGGTREVPFYQQFGGHAGIRIPNGYHASLSPDTHRGALVLEDVRGEQGDCLEVLDRERAAALARSLARFHVHWWESRAVLSAEWIPPVTEVWRGDEWFASRQALFLERFEDRLHPSCRPLFESMRVIEAWANDILSKLPETLLHADLHLDNLLFEDEGNTPVVLDWARVTRGPAVLDLGDLLSGMVPPDHIEEIFTTYVLELRALGMNVAESTLVRGLTGALLRRFIASTCGVARWTPVSSREERMIHDGISRSQNALMAWRERDPEGFVPGPTPGL